MTNGNEAKQFLLSRVTQDAQVCKAELNHGRSSRIVSQYF